MKVNTPGQPNGEEQIWVDGRQVFSKTDIVWRGAVDPSVARVDMLKYHNYFGGDGLDKTPSYDSYVTFSTMSVMSCQPNLSGPVGTCH